MIRYLKGVKLTFAREPSHKEEDQAYDNDGRDNVTDGSHDDK